MILTECERISVLKYIPLNIYHQHFNPSFSIYHQHFNPSFSIYHQHFNPSFSIYHQHFNPSFSIYIDQQLTWNIHIHKLKSKIASSMFILNRVKKQLPHDALKSIYLTLVHSHLMYGITAWGTTNYTSCKRKPSDS